MFSFPFSSFGYSPPPPPAQIVPSTLAPRLGFSRSKTMHSGQLIGSGASGQQQARGLVPRPLPSEELPGRCGPGLGTDSSNPRVALGVTMCRSAMEILDLAVGPHQWHHLRVGASLIWVYSGDWDADWGYDLDLLLDTW